jgi:hypothetical protein
MQFHLFACQHCTHRLEGAARNMIIKHGKKILQQMGRGRRTLWTEFNNVPHTVNDGYSASVKIKFSLVSMQFTHNARFEADRL